FVLHPGEFALGHTAERFAMPDDVVGIVNGKSSLGRLGLQVHATAGFVDPGFSGVIVLELSNVATLPILLRPGMKVAQMVFQSTDQPAERPYGHPELGSKYQGQSGAVASRYSENRDQPFRPPFRSVSVKETLDAHRTERWWGWWTGGGCRHG